MEKIIEKIKKLLELGNSDNKHEAELALSTAQKLMLEHDVNLKTLEKSDMIDSEFSELKRRKITDKYICALLTKFFNVFVYSTKGYVYNQRGDRYTIINIAGTKTNVAIAEYVFKFLERSFKNQLKEFKSNTYKGRKLNANAFYYGIYTGLVTRLNKSRNDYRQETGLILVDDHEKRIKELLGIVSKTTRSRINGNAESRQAGFEASKNINLRTAVNTGSNVAMIGGR